MPTNDDRRQVAARLRDIAACKDYKDYLGTNDFALAIKRVFRATVPIPRTDKAYLLSIAELIEPEERTCRVVNEKSIDLEEYGSIVGCLTVCNLSCGHVTFCASWKPERPKHCSECGAKVTE